MRNIWRNEPADWTLFEKIWLMVFALITLYLYFVWHDTVWGLLASLTGMLCVVLTAKGRVSNYYPGIINVILYAYIAYQQKYYGEVMLNLLYFLPMQFWGLYLWMNNTVHDSARTAVKVEVMSHLQRGFWLAAAAGAAWGYGFVLRQMGGSLPFVDAASTVVSIIAMILMIRRCLEQWVLWIIVDVISIIMWLAVMFRGGNDVSVCIMWTAYLVNALYGLIHWIRLYREQTGPAEWGMGV